MTVGQSEAPKVPRHWMPGAVPHSTASNKDSEFVFIFKKNYIKLYLKFVSQKNKRGLSSELKITEVTLNGFKASWRLLASIWDSASIWSIMGIINIQEQQSRLKMN